MSPETQQRPAEAERCAELGGSSLHNATPTERPIPPGMAGQVAAMFGGLPEGLALGVWSTDKRTRWVGSGDLEGLCRAALEVDAQGLDAFLLVNPRKAGLSRFRRGGNAEVTGMVGVWADVDHDLPGHAPAASGLPHPTKAEADEVLATSVPPPTLRWSTGGGEHIKWLFHDPAVFDPGQGAGLAELSEVWQSHLAESFRRAGLHFDVTADLARHLRVVGTHRRKGDTEHRVTLDDRLEFPDFGVFAHDGSIRRDWRPTPTYLPAELLDAATLRLAEAPKGPMPQPQQQRRSVRTSRDDTDTPAEHVAQNYSWADILEPAGWTRVDAGDPELWLRSGDPSSEYSAKCWQHAAVVWSSAAGLPVGKGQRLSKFRMLAHLEHGGDESACARAVRAEMAGGAR